LEVVPPVIVAVESLTRSSSGSGVEQLELEVSETLGESLSKVHAWYFGDSDLGKLDQDLAKE
jgi:hypothetical protein